MSRRQGLSLLEVVVGATILAFLALVILAATVPVSDTTSEQAAAMDMDRDATRILLQLRRELRQTGFQPDGTARVRVVDGNLRFYMRVDSDSTTRAGGPWAPADGATTPAWTSFIEYGLSGTATAFPANQLLRSEGGVPMTVMDNVRAITFDLPDDVDDANPTTSTSVAVTFTLVRRGVKATASGDRPPDIERTYSDRLEMLNQAR